MLIKNPKSGKNFKIMDPDCAICSQPANIKCDCEVHGLTVAIRQAEHKMMTQTMDNMRAWVRGHAQDHILEYFGVLTTRRKDEHAQRINQLTDHAAYYYNARPHPSEIANADADLKRGIDEDWRASVQRYPEVLEYFFSLVSFETPREDDPGVMNPPLSALGEFRKVRREEPRRDGRRTNRQQMNRPETAPPMRHGPTMPPLGRRGGPYAPPPHPGVGYSYLGSY